jgi:hypothetical protein
MTIEINPDETILSDAVDVRLALPAVDALQKIEARMSQSHGA